MGIVQHKLEVPVFQSSYALCGRKVSALFCASMITMAAVLSLSGCGGSSKPPSVAVTASATSVDGTDAVTLTATVTNDKNNGGVTWTVSGGGTLSNTSTTGATYTAPAPASAAQTVTITATSVADTTKTGTATVTVLAKLTVATTAPNLLGMVGTMYSVQLTSSTGTPPYTWTLAQGSSLPPCLSMTSAGLITSNGPLTASCAIDPNVTFDVTDSGTPNPMTASQTLDLAISAAPAIVFSTTTVPPATATYKTAYAGTMMASGGAGALTYSVTGGALPTGLTLSAGAIAGTPTAVGTFNFTVTAADLFGDSATQAYSITVGPAAQTITFGAVPAQTVGTPLTLSATASSGLAVSFASTTPSICTVSGTTATMLSTGTCTVQAAQAGNADYSAATMVPESFTVNGEAQTITFGAIASQAVGTPLTLSATASSGLAVSFASTTSGVCTVSGTTATFITTGTCTIQATQAGNSTFAAATAVPQSFTVLSESQTITFGAIAAQTVGTPLTLSATASSNLAVGFASTTSSICTVAGTTATFIASGTCTIQATQAGNSSFAAATPVSQSFTVNGKPQTITFNSPATQTVGTPLTLSATATSGLAVSFASTTAGVCSVSGTTATFIVAGTCTIKATQAGNSSYAAATPVSQSFTVNVEAQTITFNKPAAQTVGTPLTLSATASSGLAVSFASTTASICTVSGTTATFIATGTCTIKATQAGNASFAAATPVSQSFTVNGEGQTITFNNPGTQNVGTPLPLSATASSGLAVGFASQTASICTVSGTTATFIATGTCTIQATQAGNATFAAAPAVPQSFTVNGEAQTITFNNPGTQVVGTPLTLSASASSSLAVSFASTTSSTCTVSGTTATFIAAGTCTIQATQGGNSTFAAAAPVSQSVTVNPALSIATTSPLPTGVVGNAYSQQFHAAGGIGPYIWTLISNPSVLTPLGLSFTGSGTSTATVAGATPIQGGPVSFTVQVADSASHQVQGTFSVTINASLTITTTTLSPAYAITGSAYTTTLTALGGSGGDVWSVTVNGAGLGALGLGLNSSTGVLSGAAGSLAAGSATFTVQVKDSSNTTATQQYTINVYNPLALPTPDPGSLPGTVSTGANYSGTIVVSGGSGNYSWLVTGLSDSLTANNPSGNTVTISGAPGLVATVTFNVKVTDSATGLSATQNGYTIAVNEPTPVTLPSPNPITLPSANENQGYNGSINASGGTGPYTWTVNGVTITNNGTITIANGITVSNNGSNVLSVGGDPTTTTSVMLTNVVVTDSLGSHASNTYTISVIPPGSQLSGQVFLNTGCGGNDVPVVTVKLFTNPGGSLVQTTTTDNSNNNGTGNGSFSFGSVPAGNYTITPSISGPTSLFFPASQSVNLSGSNVNGVDFTASLGYTVSGAASYNGAQTGQVYLNLNNNNCGGSGGEGTSISEATLTGNGAFSIRGVPPGSYTLQGWMDSLGQGTQNATNPTGNTSVTVTNANLSGYNVALANPTFTTPTENPTIMTIIPNSQGVFIEFKPSENSNSVEDANQYLVQWSTSPTLGGGSGGLQFACTESGGVCPSHTFVATGDKGVWVLNNVVLTGSGFSFTPGQTYYFQARSFDTLASTQHPSGWCNYTSTGCSGTSGFVGVTIATPTCTGTCTAVSSSVTIPASIAINTGAPLYLGLIQLSSSGGDPIGIYVTEITNPKSGVNDFPEPITVPSGPNYAVIGILDQNKNGGFGAGDISNTNDNIQATLTIAGSTQTVTGITLPTANSTVQLQTQYSQNTFQGGSNTNYNLNFNVREGNKLPVSVTLISGPNVIEPVDISNECQNCGNLQFQYSAGIGANTPSVGDTYTFKVTYSDGTVDNGTVSGAVTAFGSTGAVAGASDLATGLSPTGSGGSTTPTFTWTYPANASDYTYQFYLCCNSNGNIWQIPGNNSKSNGFTSSQIPMPAGITWGTDPTGGGSTPSVGSLTSGTQYDWSIQVQDSVGNSAQTNVSYTP
jgi:hypothetical protein